MTSLGIQTVRRILVAGDTDLNSTAANQRESAQELFLTLGSSINSPPSARGPVGACKNDVNN